MAEPKQIFTYNSKDFVYDVTCRTDGQKTDVTSRFDEALRCGWEEKMNRGLFRYHLGDLETRVLAGEHGYIAQLNIERGSERRKPQPIMSIQQHFNPKLFNFNQIRSAEILFELHRDEQCGVTNGSRVSCVVIINVSPLEFGHCLLVPEPTRCHPQILTPLAVQVGLETLFLSADPGYRVGFNSLGAFASVNHLHLHGYYLKHALRIECARADLVAPGSGLYRLVHFPRAFMFYTDVHEDARAVAGTVCRLTDLLVDRNITHNVFMTRGCHPDSNDKDMRLQRYGVRVFIWPRKSCFGEKEERAFNVALCELAGHLPFKNRHDYENMNEDRVKAIVQGFLLTDQEFTDLQQQIVSVL